ncbi:hypothetical protein [Streptacidiphilus carbonis]|uniref:hypothetical protein n=1 Tax=Streptacidiphilus carbonis TaxID=105422 RepID=UPI0005A9DBFA|nr:hypothetical protein [Streptacidiphilus carbonis]
MTTTSAALTPAHVDRWAAPFGELLDVVSRRVAGRMSPAWQSDASDEISETAALVRSDGISWGPNPGSITLVVAEVLMRAALEHAHAVRMLLLLRPSSAMSIESLVRSALEAASQAWWLLEPGIGGRERVVRRLLLERKTAAALEKSAAKMGYTVSSDHGKTIDDTDKERVALGIQDDFGPKGGWVGAAKQRPLDYTTLVERFMEQTGQDAPQGPYAFLSGTAHAELWRILYAYTSEKDTAGANVFMPRTSADFVRFAVSACIDAAAQPAIRAFQWLGHGAALAEIRQLREPIREAMKP